MSIHEWAAYAVAALCLLGALKMWWSISGRQLQNYRLLVDKGLRTVEDKNQEIRALRQAEEAWREANRALRKLSKEHEATIAAKDQKLVEKDQQIRSLKDALDRSKAANDKLTEVIGNMERATEALNRDVQMLKNQVFELRAKLGMEL